MEEVSLLIVVEGAIAEVVLGWLGRHRVLLEKEVKPGVVTNWVNKCREYVVTLRESYRINLIFGLSATLGDYPELVEPKVLDETR